MIYADVHTKGIKTMYPMIGDLFGWICVVGMIVLIGLSLTIKNDLTTSNITR